MESLFYLVIVISGSLLLHFLAIWMESKGWLYYRKKPKGGSGVGTALEELNRFLRPSVQHVQREKKKLKKEEQGNEDGP
jgi:hypothetical protein